MPDDCDCMPADAAAWATPGEVTDLQVSHTGGPAGTTTLDWNAPGLLGGDAVVYDTVTSTTAGDFGSPFVVCGEILHFVVRAGNSCAEGSAKHRRRIHGASARTT